MGDDPFARIQPVQHLPQPVELDLVVGHFIEGLPVQQVDGVVVGEHIEEQGTRPLQMPVLHRLPRVASKDEAGNHGDVPELAPGQFGPIDRRLEVIHEVGGVIMGDDATRSVLNEYCQSWEVDNLFVTDGGCFVSNADKNPTLSIMAIAWRASEYIVEQLGQGSIG